MARARQQQHKPPSDLPHLCSAQIHTAGAFTDGSNFGFSRCRKQAAVSPSSGFPGSLVPALPHLGSPGFLKSSSSSWPTSQPAPTLHPSHSFTGRTHFHNGSLDTFPALSTALPKRLATICHLLHQHTAITLSPQHTNLLHQLLLPALPPTTLGRTKHLEQLLSTAGQGKQEGRAISPSVCLFVIEEQPTLTGPGSFTSSSRPPAWFWLQPEQVMGTKPRRAAALPCCKAEHTFTQSQLDPQK